MYTSYFKNQEGSTLIETLVSMAILISVLLPTSLFLGYFANAPVNKEKIVAIGLAQAKIEEILEQEDYTVSKEETEGKWIIKSKVSKESVNLAHIQVSVYKKNKSEPIIYLNTERLFYGKRNFQ